MLKFKMTCPDCTTVFTTTCPKALIWEVCPECRRHVWDGYDVLMAEIQLPGRKPGHARGLLAEN